MNKERYQRVRLTEEEEGVLYREVKVLKERGYNIHKISKKLGITYYKVMKILNIVYRGV